MYQYKNHDHALVRQRVDQFRGQIARRLSGELSEAEFKPLRLMNGLYLQLHAYMLRVAIPYGTFSTTQMRKLAHIARVYDKGYGHFTTRQNIQYNWPRLEQVPDILDELADVEMHAIQTSGNCIRNTTSDPFAGAACDEVEDPRPYCEALRQWSTLHPEFTFLPRKFKIAVTAATQDRAAIRVHDIGLRLKQNQRGETGFEVYAGGGLGRTPMIGHLIRDFLPRDDLLTYMEAILRVYNMMGRRDNKYKARIKILMHEHPLDEIIGLIEGEWQATLREEKNNKTGLTLKQMMQSSFASYFKNPDFEVLGEGPSSIALFRVENKKFNLWMRANITAHKQTGYAIVTISLKGLGEAPGDIRAEQMDVVADLAERYSFGGIRASHEQNLILPHVRQIDLPALWHDLDIAGLAHGNIGLISDMITCPGLDYCALANARSIPLAQDIHARYESLDQQHDIGPLKLKISGRINACGHHHVGHIGILGVDRKGEEYYQITLGGDANYDASIGKILGPALKYDQVVPAIETLIETYLTLRLSQGETFIQSVIRLGNAPYKEALYA